jgi:hypothetical protein
MNTLLTLDSLLLSSLVVLFSAIVWIVKRYIAKDDIWKGQVDEKLDDLKAVRMKCLQEFATKESVDRAWNVIRENQTDISSLKSWRETVERRHE